MITGLSLLLLFVALGHAIGWPSDRGMLTIWLAHVTFCTAYVAVVIASRLRELDRSIEEAAMDLGAAPLKVFFVITLPMIMPAVISGWLLAFTLSLDDLVIASFGKTADSRYPACKTRLKPLKSSTMAMRCRAGRGIIFREDIHWDL